VSDNVFVGEPEIAAAKRKKLERTTFRQVPDWLLFSPKVSDRGIRLYAVLASHRNEKSGQCNPSRERLAKRVRCSTRSVDRAIDELVAAGAIEKRAGHGAKKATTHYVLRFADPNNSSQLATDGDMEAQVATCDESKSSLVATKRKEVNDTTPAPAELAETSSASAELENAIEVLVDVIYSLTVAATRTPAAR
jgi:DNA-binding transcriptional MocR family regulator